MKTEAVVSLAALHEAAARRPAGYVDAVLAAAIRTDEQYAYIPRDSYSQLVKQFSSNPVSLRQKVANFATSAARHLAAGMPQATEEQVAARFAICQTCEHFDGQACRQCGCPVVREKKFLSKLSWANESCPVGKWGPV
jgi:hypothetical protein